MRQAVLIALLLLSLALSADIIQIGSGSLYNQGLPIEPFRFFSYSQQIYLASQIGTAGLIHSVSLQYDIRSNNFLEGNSDWDVYLGHTQRQNITSWVPIDSLNLVFSGVLSETDFSSSLPGTGWLTISLSTPFFYNGSDNLILAVDENMPLNSTNLDDFISTEVAVPMGITFISNDVNPDPANPPEIPWQSAFFIRNAQANLRLEISPHTLTPTQPFPEDQAIDVELDAALQWHSDAGSFDLFFGSNSQNLPCVAQGLQQSRWQPPEPLQLYTSYFWQVLAHENGESHQGPLWSFITRGEGISAPTNLSGFYNGDQVCLNWQAPIQGNPVLYRVIRNGHFLAATHTTDYQDLEVAPGQVLYYWILAQNSLGEISSPSNTISVHIPEIIPHLILREGFEILTPFSQTIPGWQNIDKDLSNTWSFEGLAFPGSGGPLPWLVFSPSQSQPPFDAVAAYEGLQSIAAIASYNPPNNDWLITPRLNLGRFPRLTFWARSHTADYGLERLKLYISTTGTQTENFTQIGPSPWISVPAQWTQYNITLSNWEEQDVWLAFQCCSWDAKILYLDDIVVTGEGGWVPVQDEFVQKIGFQVFPNPCRGGFHVDHSSRSKFSLSIHDIRGRKLYSSKDIAQFNSAEHKLSLPAGIYFLKLENNAKSEVKRLVVIP